MSTSSLVETSVDGKEWKVVVQDGMFDNIVNNPVSQEVVFEVPVLARMIRLVPIRVEDVNGSVEGTTYGVSVFAELI